jgi:hypothetical protein
MTQPEALRLAKIQSREWPAPCPTERDQTAAELRRLHEVNQELLVALNSTISACNFVEYGLALMNARAAIAKGETK